MLAVSAVTLMVGLTAVAVGTAAVTRHRAEAAADLGAIAAASAALRGQPGACAQAGEVVRANGAKLTGCRLVGADALVTAAVGDDAFGRGWGVARVTARAGPAKHTGVGSGARRVRAR